MSVNCIDGSNFLRADPWKSKEILMRQLFVIIGWKCLDLCN